MHLTDSDDVDEEEMGHCQRLMVVLRCFLLARGSTPTLTEELHW